MMGTAAVPGGRDLVKEGTAMLAVLMTPLYQFNFPQAHVNYWTMSLYTSGFRS